MKKIIIFIFLCVTMESFGQSWTYAKLEPNYGEVNRVNSSILDANGNLYMAGEFGPSYHGQPPAGIYINKYDANGNLIWSDTLNSPYSCPRMTALLFSSHNTLIIAGQLCNGQNNIFGFIVSSNNPNAAGFVAEFDFNGNCLNANTLVYAPRKILFNQDSTLSIAGECNIPFSNLNFQTSTGYFVGNFQNFSVANWLQPAPLPASYGLYDPFIASDNYNNIYFSEFFGHNVKKINSAGSNIICSTQYPAMHCIGNNFYHAMLSHFEKYSAAGTLLWQKNFVPWVTPNNVISYNGNLLVSGYFRDSMQYGNLKYKADSLGFNHLFILEIDTNGNGKKLLIAPHVDSYCGYSPKEIETREIFSNNNMDIYVAGEIEGARAFGNDTLWAGCEDPHYVFHAKASLLPLTVVETKIKRVVNIYPNPSSGLFTVQIPNYLAGTRVIVRGVLGNCLWSQNCRNDKSVAIDLTGQPKGIYFLEIVSDGERVVKKIVLE